MRVRDNFSQLVHCRGAEVYDEVTGMDSFGGKLVFFTFVILTHPVVGHCFPVLPQNAL